MSVIAYFLVPFLINLSSSSFTVNGCIPLTRSWWTWADLNWTCLHISTPTRPSSLSRIPSRINGRSIGPLRTLAYCLQLSLLEPITPIWILHNNRTYVMTSVGALIFMDHAALLTTAARRSFQALRLANFLFRPSLDVVQALLVLDNMFQNNGQSDAAWALLGTTVRLAQTIGLHTERSIAYLPQYMQLKAKTLWYVLAVDPYCTAY